MNNLLYTTVYTFQIRGIYTHILRHLNQSALYIPFISGVFTSNVKLFLLHIPFKLGVFKSPSCETLHIPFILRVFTPKVSNALEQLYIPSILGAFAPSTGCLHHTLCCIYLSNQGHLHLLWIQSLSARTVYTFHFSVFTPWHHVRIFRAAVYTFQIRCIPISCIYSKVFTEWNVSSA